MIEINVSALSKLFAASVLRELSDEGQSSLLVRLVGQSGLRGEFEKLDTVADWFDFAYSVLRQNGNRDDYFFRSSVVQKVLLGSHSLNTASMLSEFRTGKSRADLVFLNGTATAYEVKSDRDTTARLETQLRSYMEVFAATTVVTSDKHLKNVLSIAPKDVGISTITRRGSIHVERPVVHDPSRVKQTAILDSLQIGEAQQILHSFGLEPPHVPNTLRRSVYADLFAQLDPERLHSEMVRTLKRTRSLAGLSGLLPKLPRSLTAAAVSFKWASSTKQENLLRALAVQTDEALQWR